MQQQVTGDVAHLLKVKGDGDPVIISTPGNGGTLPVVVGAVNGVLYGVTIALVAAAVVTHAAVRSLSWRPHVVHQFAERLGTLYLVRPSSVLPPIHI
jgi:hypothetical protein